MINRYFCTHAWHLTCMHAPLVHMFVGVCACVHVHVTCIRMYACLLVAYSIKYFLKLKLISYIAALSKKRDHSNQQNKMLNSPE